MTRLPSLAGPTVALTMTLSLTFAAPAGAATVLGQTVTPTAPNACAGFPDFNIVQESRGATSSATPAAGVITSWSFMAGPSVSYVELRVYHHNTADDTWQPVSPADPLQAVPAGSGLHKYPSRTPIAAGDFAGLHTAGGGCYANTPSGDKARYYYDTSPTPVGTAASYSSISAIVDLAATVEPDADHDGYGDETQDGCPISAATQASCTDTAITKKPKRHSRGPKSKLRFVASVAGSTFTCSLDTGAAKPCTTPAKYKCLKPGGHTFSVAATSPFGYADPTPATVKFRVSRQRHGC